MDSKKRVRILAIPGSLRARSYNRALLRAARRVAPRDVEIEICDLGAIPLFDADVEARGDPGPVVDFKRRVGEADALLIATPEYQHGIPGVLKNALDWASRPPGEAPLTGKPTAILGATTGSFGTARAQEALRRVLTYNACPTVATPEVLVARASEKTDDEGEFTDGPTLEFVGALVEALVRLTRLHTQQ